MKVPAILIAMILAISLAMNLYLYTELQQVSQQNGHFTNDNFAATTGRIHQGFQAEYLAPHADKSLSVPHEPESSDAYHEQQTTRLAALQQAQTWLAQGEFNRLETFLQNYLKAYPQDIDFLLLEADFIAQTSLLSDAITHYYSLLMRPMTSSQYQQIQSKIDGLAGNTIVQLQKSYSWDILAVFVEPLLQVDPTNRGFILALANAYGRQQQENLMENTLAALPFDDPDVMAIRDLIATHSAQSTPQNSSDEVSETASPLPSLGNAISLEQSGDQYLVSAQLSGKMLKLLIDTGASTTAISEGYFEQLNSRFKHNFVGRFKIATANGMVLAPMYQFAQLQIDNARVENITVVVLNMSGLRNADGLLGMNFLREFDFRIDQKNAKLYLTKH